MSALLKFQLLLLTVVETLFFFCNIVYSCDQPNQWKVKNVSDSVRLSLVRFFNTILVCFSHHAKQYFDAVNDDNLHILVCFGIYLHMWRSINIACLFVAEFFFLV